MIARLGALRFIAWAMLVVDACSCCAQFALTRPARGARTCRRAIHGLVARDGGRSPPCCRRGCIAEAIRRIGANAASLVGSLGPVFTIGFGALLLGEPLHAIQLAGAALVLAGVLLVTLKPRAAPPPARARPPTPVAALQSVLRLANGRFAHEENAMAPDTLERDVPALKDPALLRMQCYVDGAWCDADDGSTTTIVQPGHRPARSAPPRCSAPPRRGARSRPPARRVAGVARQDREGAQRRRCASGSS